MAIKADLAFLIPGNMFTMKFVKSWTNTLIYLLEMDYSFTYHFGYMPVISSSRNHLVGKSPIKDYNITADSPINAFDNEAQYNKVIFIDSDMVWESNDIQQLIDSPYDITVAPYVLGDKETSSIRIEDKFVPKTTIQKYTKPFPIHSAGLGFTACKFETLQKIPYPWFQTTEIINEYETGERYGGTIGEDVYFFMKAKENGAEAYCDPRIKVGHEKSTILTM